MYRGKYRDCDHPGEDMGALYAGDVRRLCEESAARGGGVACYIAESLQSCGGQVIPPPNYLREVFR